MHSPDTLWSDKDTQFLLDNHLKLTYAQMGVELNRTTDAINAKIRRMRDAGLMPERGTHGRLPDVVTAKKCQELRRSGMKLREIAESLEMKFSQVVYYIYKAKDQI